MRLVIAAAFLLVGSGFTAQVVARNVEHINEYNQRMDGYRRGRDCGMLDLAKNRALMQLNQEGDPSLASDWNRYASQCGLTLIRTSEAPAVSGNSKTKVVSVQDGPNCLLVHEIMQLKRGVPISRECPDGSWFFISVSP